RCLSYDARPDPNARPRPEPAPEPTSKQMPTSPQPSREDDILPLRPGLGSQAATQYNIPLPGRSESRMRRRARDAMMPGLTRPAPAPEPTSKKMPTPPKPSREDDIIPF